VILLYLQPHSPFPNDGIRYQEPEARFAVQLAQGRVRAFPLLVV
jgi:hypothetical protein